MDIRYKYIEKLSGPFVQAIIRDHIDEIKLNLIAVKKAKRKISLDELLHLACLFGSIASIEFFLKEGAKPQAPNKKGELPIQVACETCEDSEKDLGKIRKIFAKYEAKELETVTVKKLPSRQKGRL